MSAFRHQASLLINVLFAVAVVVLALHKSSPAPTTSAVTISSQKTETVTRQDKKTEETATLTEPSKLPLYTDVASASDRRRLIVDRLRAMGVPNDVLALVARVDMEAQWDPRFEQCHGDMDKLAALQLEMDMSKDTEMRAALGEEGFRRWDQGCMLWEAMSTKVDVSSSEAASIYSFKKKLQQRQHELEQARLKGTMDDAAIDDAYNKALSEYNQQLKTVLGEERYAKSQQLDEGFAAEALRHQLAKANPTDAQFQELFKAERESDKARSELDRQFQNDMSSLEYLKKLKTLNEARDKEYQRVLGTDAFDTLRKEQDPSYSQMKKYETVWGLDSDKIDYAYNAMRNYEKSVDDYKTKVMTLQSGGQNVDWDAVGKKLQQFATETQQALQSQLGQDSFDKLQRNRVFRWASLGYQPGTGSTGAMQ
jgi:hypothetical protein